MAGGENGKRKYEKRKRSEELFHTPSARTLKQYLIEEKLEIIDYAKNNGNRAAGREYNVAESSIREWRKNEAKLRSLKETEPERNRLSGGGRRIISEKIQEEIQPEVIIVPLSYSSPPKRIKDDDSLSLHYSDDQQSSHSNSPILHGGSSSSRRKSTAPKKYIVEAE